MATPQIVTVRDFTTYRYSELSDTLDTPINDILARAEDIIQNFVAMRIVPTNYVERFKTPSQTIFVTNRPIISVTAIKRKPRLTSSWETLDLSQIEVYSEQGVIETEQIVRDFYLEVSYRAGMDTISEDLKEAILLQATILSFKDLEVYGTGDSRPPGIGSLYADRDAILKKYSYTSTVFH